MSNCTECHKLGEEVTNKKCLDCHTEIQNLIENDRGYHSDQEVTAKKCYECHNEHHGRDFEIVRFDKDNFDHGKTGYKLVDSHSKIDCNECHKPEFITDPELRERENSFLGLNRKCTTCHEDYHLGTLGKECLSCHNYQKFRPAPKFNHEETKFVLTGKHKDTECKGCHKIGSREGREFQEFAGIEFSSCESCHRDVHNGKFEKSCSNCHNTRSFRNVNSIETFQHSKTGYKLIGKHQNIKCETCHTGKLTDPLPHGKCLDCHEDYHEGQLTSGGKTIDCEKCHTEKGFSPSRYTISEHQNSGFKLIGAHLATPCQNCHLEGEQWKFQFTSNKCITCHENVHGNSISKKFFGDSDCERCHTAEKWATVDFDHDKTEFKLKGKHIDVTCGECHIQSAFTGKDVHVFDGLNSNCQNCHKDIHYGQFKEGKITKCERCHNFKNWKPNNFKHSETRFKLDGSHKDLDCNQCHKPIEKDENKFIKYKYEDVKCEVCHS